MFGKYYIISKIGKGTSCDVYLAEHLKLKAYRAVKCINKVHAMQPQLLLEIDILKNLKHPGIPIIYDVEEDDTTYYIIEEYIQGQSLGAYMLHQDRISAEQAVHIVLQVCNILKYLHEHKPKAIIYQDLKPEHIILYEKQIFLIDFGISSYITSKGNAFQSFGTQGYAAPEKYQGIPCDIRADIYGIGKILEFIAAKMPKQESQILKPIIWKATAYARENRYPSVEILMQALKQILRLKHT